MKKEIRYILYIIITVNLSACKTPYTPEPITASTNYLVVEGLINISDSTFITLSRTVNISAKTTVKPELKATITIESNNGGSYPLKELGNGVYAAPNYNLNPVNQYRVRIKTANSSTYTSDFEQTMVSPQIDSISWKTTATALNIYTNTHDPNNATRYYRWDYNEEWEFRSDYDSFFVSDGLTISYRDPDKHVYQCYGGDTSHIITLGTSSQLAQDIINQQLINTIPSSAEKIGRKYTILVKQYALTKNAYDYWTLLKKNTEQLGSIFDSQPSASIGNIHNVNVPSEPVIGYISTGTITTNRIFITKSQLPHWVTTPAYPITAFQCELDTIGRVPGKYPWQNQYINWKAPEFIGPLYIEIPVDAGFNPVTSGIDFWLSARPLCVDCTLRGKTTPPPYWK
jgi:hypothetical protein